MHYCRIYWFQGEVGVKGEVGVAWTGERWRHVLFHSIKLKEGEEKEEEEEEGDKGEKEEGGHWMSW